MDLQSIAPDLCPPEMIDAPPAAGRRVRQALDGCAGTGLFHALYLPTDWRPGARFPVIVEYPPNQYKGDDGTTFSGNLEHCTLGYGISGGASFIWLALPFVNPATQQQQVQWWGDVGATVDYCVKAVHSVCREFGGDPNALLLAGFSRGAIACNFIGLHDDVIAPLWRGFIAHSHYEGVRPWPGIDRVSALQRLQRLNGRPQFISHEGSVAETEQYLAQTGVAAPYTFVSMPFETHTDAWVLRDIPERRQLRRWIAGVLAL